MTAYFIALLFFASMSVGHSVYLALPEHRARQWSRLRSDGWTLPWPLCGLYWFGLERLAPPSLRLRPHCGDCGCPVSEHDVDGFCRARDMPSLGIYLDCTCKGVEL